MSLIFGGHLGFLGDYHNLSEVQKCKGLYFVHLNIFKPTDFVNERNGINVRL